MHEIQFLKYTVSSPTCAKTPRRVDWTYVQWFLRVMTLKNKPRRPTSHCPMKYRTQPGRNNPLEYIKINEIKRPSEIARGLAITEFKLLLTSSEVHNGIKIETINIVR